MKVFRKLYRKILRIPYDYRNISRLKNRKEITVISSNCVGGVLLHDLHMRFDSPTINMFMSAEDFLELCENLEYYMKADMEEIRSDYAYPMALLGNRIKLHLVHYENYESARQMWMRRRQRIHWDNLYLIMVDRDGCNEGVASRFDKLIFPNKVLLSYKNYLGVDCCVVIPNTEEEGQIRDLCQYQSRYRGKRWLDEWDYVNFLNKNR